MSYLLHGLLAISVSRSLSSHRASPRNSSAVQHYKHLGFVLTNEILDAYHLLD